MNYKSMLSEITDIILNNTSKNSHWIIVGDNSSGKSELLKQLINNITEDKYFIDSVNRFFDVLNVLTNAPEIVSMIDSNEIVARRVMDDAFNLTDTFGFNDHIWRLYPHYKAMLSELMFEFLGIEFEIKREKISEEFGESNPKAYINGVKHELSSGYQAIIRIFAELIYYCNIKNKSGYVIIDEIDEFLSQKNAAKILNFLTEKFSEIKFVMSTHSNDLLANSNNYNLIVLEKKNYRLYDGNDFNTLTDINTLMNTLYNKRSEFHKSDIDIVLDELLDCKIMGYWNENKEKSLLKLKEKELTGIQTYIIKQIERWD